MWSAVGELVSAGFRELRAEQSQELLEANFTRVNGIMDGLVDLVLEAFDDEPATRSLRNDALNLKRKVLREIADRLQQAVGQPGEQFYTELQTFKLLMLKGVFDPELVAECLDSVAERLRSNKALLGSNVKSKEIAELRKENALLKQTTDFQREEIDFLKTRNSFEERRVSLERTVGVQAVKTLISKAPSFEDKAMSIETISLVPTPSRQSHRRADITKLPKSSAGSKPVIGRIINASSKNSLMTIKNEVLNEKLLPQLGDDLIGLLAENRELKNKIEQLTSDLKYADNRLQDYMTERHHAVSLMNTDNNSVVEALKRQLTEIKETHSVEKSLLAKRVEEETERSRKRIQEMESNFAQKAAMLNQEAENRYNEMTTTLKSALESTTYELRETQSRMKDLNDQKRIESVRYETRIQDLKNELRKAEAKFETIKRRLKEDQAFNLEHSGSKFVKSDQHKRIANLLSSVRSDSNFDRDYIKTDILLSTDGPEVSELTSTKRNTFFDGTKMNSQQVLCDSEENRARSHNKSTNFHRQESMDLINSSPNGNRPIGTPVNSKLFRQRAGAKRFPLNIHVPDDEPPVQSTKTEKFKYIQSSKEDLFHAEIIKYFNNHCKVTRSGKKNTLFDITASATSLKHPETSFQNSHCSYSSKKFDMSPNSVSKPLDYFIKKKQSMQTPL